MLSKGEVLALDLRAPLAFDLRPLLPPSGTQYGAPVGYRGPVAVSKGTVLARDLGTPSSSSGPLAFDLGHQLAQEAPESSKGASLTIDLGASPALRVNWLLI